MMKNFFRRTLIISIVLAGFSACTSVAKSHYSDVSRNRSISVITSKKQVPVLTGKDENLIFQIKIQAKESGKDYIIKEIEISLEGTTDLNDIEAVKLYYTGKAKDDKTNRQFGKSNLAAPEINFTDNFILKDEVAYFSLSVKLKSKIDLTHRIDVSCKQIETNVGKILPDHEVPSHPLRVGVAMRQHGDDSVDTYRIPGLTTTTNGTMLAIYDVRRDSKRDLQGDIDIGLSRSTDGGISWEPMQIAMDRGKWGGLPQKFNGISDGCILVNDQNNDIFIAGLWMHGVLDSTGKWIEGLNDSSSNWEHQWRGKGSQPGFEEKETCQFLITKSTDDGRNWSEPVNLTRMYKQEDWWLWAPAPGHGITLNDGTLVFPTQGRDAAGKSFSNITSSKDGGKTWKTSNYASSGTTENMIVQLGDGSIMLNARDGKNKGNSSSTNGRVINTSMDMGKNWTVHPTSHGVLIEPACMASLHKHVYTENGEKKSILLFSNPNSKSGRNHMTIKVSFDDGASWPEKNWILLDEGSGRGYSCLTSIDEKAIGILYEGSKADMIFQKITLSELIGK